MTNCMEVPIEIHPINYIDSIFRSPSGKLQPAKEKT